MQNGISCFSFLKKAKKTAPNGAVRGLSILKADSPIVLKVSNW
jgi:hypothetical protein